LCGTAIQLLGLRGRIGRFFLIEDGKIPDYAVVDSPVSYKTHTIQNIRYLYSFSFFL